jgi:hypothetical protein
VTTPTLPQKSYYHVVDGRNGVIAKSDTKRFEQMDTFLRKRDWENGDKSEGEKIGTEK